MHLNLCTAHWSDAWAFLHGCHPTGTAAMPDRKQQGVGQAGDKDSTEVYISSKSRLHCEGLSQL